MSRNAATVVLVGAFLQGCVPTLEIAQRQIDFEVVDESGVPIRGAKVEYKRVLGNTRYQQSVFTNEDGHASFPMQKRLGTASFGDRLPPSWQWCVSAPGFERFLSDSVGENTVALKERIRLIRGPSEACPPAASGWWRERGTLKFDTGWTVDKNYVRN